MISAGVLRQDEGQISFFHEASFLTTSSLGSLPSAVINLWATSRGPGPFSPVAGPPVASLPEVAYWPERFRSELAELLGLKFVFDLKVLSIDLLAQIGDPTEEWATVSGLIETGQPELPALR